ncbi:SDR family oxidoreductase [Sorangium sp. So ce321]|uniref:SDR family oxidoreductase n=1 Tax=Sorangium sp. So ce321 TaxID=3133300 RepID=UPI003F6137B0
MQSHDLLEHVRSVFVRMTRYPDEVVVADADLEQDLGIDSVKRGEILATLRADFGLPDALKATPDELRTVASVSDFLTRTIAARPGAAPRSGDAGGGGHAEAARHANGHGEAAGHAGHANGHGEPAGYANGHGEASRHANGHVEPARYANGHVEAAGYANGHAEPAGYANGHAEPAGYANGHVEPARYANGHAEPAGYANGHAEPARYANGHAEPAVYANGHAEPARHASGHAEPARHAGGHAATVARAPAAPAPRRPAPAARAALAGKTVLVTGSSRGLGRAIATKLGRAGARVVVNSFHSRDDGEEVADEICAAGGDAVHVWGSVANVAHLDKLFETIERDVGELHHFVSNASNGRFGPLEQTTPEHWELAFRTNVIGYHQCALRAARLMERRGGGRIVALSSNGSSRYLEHFGAMGAVKAAVESLTRALAVELAPRNVQVNCVSAGPIYGHVTSNYPDHERILPYWESRTPGGRLCTEEDVADAVLLLLSDGARMINGATLTVDGGGSLCI